MALVTGGTLALLLLLLRRHWALLFADESETDIIDLVTQLMPSLVVSQLGIGLIAVLAGEGDRWRTGGGLEVIRQLSHWSVGWSWGFGFRSSARLWSAGGGVPCQRDGVLCPGPPCIRHAGILAAASGAGGRLGWWGWLGHADVA